jgi:hypothetical protein
MLEHANRNVSARERMPVQEKVAHLLDAVRIRAPVFQTVLAEPLDHVQSLGRTNVPISLLLDLCGMFEWVCVGVVSRGAGCGVCVYEDRVEECGSMFVCVCVFSVSVCLCVCFELCGM